jgi:hypothetical protein
MALTKRVIDLPLTGGLNQIIGDKNITAPNLLKLENGVFNKESKIDKRYGNTNLGQTINTGTLTTPAALGSIRDELLMLSQDKLYSFSEADSTWYDRGETSIASTELAQIAASSENTIEGLDVIHEDGIRVATWLEGTTYYYSVMDNTTLTPIVDKATLITSAGSVYPRLAKINGFIFIVYNDSTNLKVLRIPTTNPSTSSTTTIYATLDSNGYFDATGYGDDLYVLFKLTGASTLRLSKLDRELTVVATNTLASEDADNYRTMALNVFNSTSEGGVRVCLGWSITTGTALRAAVYDTNLVATIAAKQIDTNANLDSLTIAVDSTDGSTIGYYYGISNGTTTNYLTQYASLTLSGGAVSTPVVFIRSVAPVSKAAYHNNIGYFNVLHDSTLQATYFTVNTSGKVVAKFAASQGPTHALSRRTSNFESVNSTDYIFGALKKGRIQSENATLFANLDAQFATLSFDSVMSGVSANMHDDFLIAGGILKSYDGKSTTEYGFHLFPEDVTATATSGAGVPDGTYLVQAIYEWTDARGVRFQSAPSVAKSVSTSGGNNQITVTVPSLRITDKSDEITRTSRTPVKVRVFITEASGTIPYFNSETINDNILSADTQTIVVTTDPASTTSQEILYTSGGAIENIAPASCNFIFTHDNRPVILGLENPNQIQFGKDIKVKTGVGFNEDFSINIDPLGGGITAGASMDNYHVIFKKTATYVISGSGPNDLGLNSTLGAPQLISSDIGCSEPKSVLQTPDGIVFRSTKGIYLLSRSLKLTYIGAQVKDEVDGSEILRTNIIKDSNELRFVTNNSKTLVYNYFFRRWSVFTTPGILDATTWRNADYVYLSSTKVMKEDTTTYLDDGSYVSTKIRTGWIRLAGLQGFQRLHRLGLLGTYHTNNVFQLKLRYDYSEIVKETVNITASDLVNTSTWGDAATWGANDVWGGSTNDEVFQTRHHIARQKCQSISVEISDSITGIQTIGQGFSLDGLSFTVSGKKGLFKTSSTRNS